MRSTLKDVILLCKGWYNEDAYYSVTGALKAYYKQHYSDSIEFSNWQSALLNIVLKQAMFELSEEYPDRLRMFINGYLMTNTLVYGLPDKETDYDIIMFYKIISFFCAIPIHGNNLRDIDTTDYFRIIVNKETGSKKTILTEPIIY